MILSLTADQVFFCTHASHLSVLHGFYFSLLYQVVVKQGFAITVSKVGHVFSTQGTVSHMHDFLVDALGIHGTSKAVESAPEENQNNWYQEQDKRHVQPKRREWLPNLTVLATSQTRVEANSDAMITSCQ